MHAMILAAGRGERMRPLTDHTPKPLLPVADKSLIVWHIERLVRAGLCDIVINHAWMGECIEAALGDGARWGARIRYSPEPVALETAGGIAQALPMLGDEPFLVVNGDVWCDWPPGQAAQWAAWLDGCQQLACLLMAENPLHHPAGDFALQNGVLIDAAKDDVLPAAPRLTYTGIGVYHPALFADVPANQATPLAPLLRAAIARRAVLGLRHEGVWLDVGTPERLARLDVALRARNKKKCPQASVMFDSIRK